MIGNLILGILLLASGASSPGADDPQTQLAQELAEIVRDRFGTHSLWSRVQAAQTLGRMGPDSRAAVPALVALLEDAHRTDPLVIDEAVVKALGRIGRPARYAIPAMVRVSGKDFDLERTVNEAITRIISAGDSGEAPVLVKNLRDRDEGIRLRAAKTLGAMGSAGRDAVPALLEALQDRDSDVRHQALWALRQIQPGMKPTEGEVAVYVLDLRDSDPAVRLRGQIAGANGAGHRAGLAGTSRRRRRLGSGRAPIGERGHQAGSAALRLSPCPSGRKGWG